MKVAVFNLGCKVNQYECDVISEKLSFEGHEVSEGLVFADAYILNTCAVTGEAERKSRQAVSRCLALNPNAKIFVLGCASQKAPDSFKKDGVLYISGTADKFAVTERIFDENFADNNADTPIKYEEGSLTTPHRTRAYVKIQDGCNHFCSYCIIPYLRGRSRSRTIEDVVKEVRALAPKTKEIVLTGIDLMDFGKGTGRGLNELFSAIKDVDVRIRLGSIYAEKITEELLDSMFSMKKFCPHFHLSLQSGDNDVLKKMNRRYTAEEYLEKINLIRKCDENAGITTDVIVGFPTETEEGFENTVKFVKEAKFSDIHVFPFSARSGTRAASFPPIDKTEMIRRKKILADVKRDLHYAFLEKNVGKEQEVLIEEEKEGYNVGYSRNYVRVYTKKQGEIVTVTPNKIEKDGLKEE